MRCVSELERVAELERRLAESTATLAVAQQREALATRRVELHRALSEGATRALVQAEQVVAELRALQRPEPVQAAPDDPGRAELLAQIEELRHRTALLEAELERTRATLSWRVTTPLRGARGLQRRVSGLLRQPMGEG